MIVMILSSENQYTVFQTINTTTETQTPFLNKRKKPYKN